MLDIQICHVSWKIYEMMKLSRAQFWSKLPSSMTLWISLTPFPRFKKKTLQNLFLQDLSLQRVQYRHLTSPKKILHPEFPSSTVVACWHMWRSRWQITWSPETNQWSRLHYFHWFDDIHVIDSIHLCPIRYKELPRCVASRSCGDELHFQGLMVLFRMLKVYTSSQCFTVRQNSKGGCSIFSSPHRLECMSWCRFLSLKFDKSQE